MDTITKEKEIQVNNLLKGIHGQRQGEITEILKVTRNAEDYIRRMNREDIRYQKITAAIEEYFMGVDEWKKLQEKMITIRLPVLPEKCPRCHFRFGGD